MSPEALRSLIERAAAEIAAAAPHLTELDQAIGDGDHGHNLQRGFNAVAEQAESLSALPVGAALQKAGMTLVMKVGGASGPLYGSLLMAAGKAAPAEPGIADLPAMLKAGILAVMSRGKAAAGEKTMLDVLVPACEALQQGVEAGLAPAALAATVRRREAAEATRAMQATKGRASFLGERSVGHLDPGARSSALADRMRSATF